MDRSILSRVKALEENLPEDLVIYAETKDKEVVEAKVKDVLTEDGELKEDFSNIGGVVKGNNLKDLDRVLSFFRMRAESDM